MESVNLTHFVAVGGMSWGKAETVQEAFMNWLRHERPKGDMTVHFRHVNAEAYVDDMGTLYAAKESVKLPDVKVKKATIERYMNALDEIDEMLYPVEDAIVDMEVKA